MTAREEIALEETIYTIGEIAQFMMPGDALQVHIIVALVPIMDLLAALYMIDTTAHLMTEAGGALITPDIAADHRFEDQEVEEMMSE
jgi:hypothetical protein